jgi:hypothetical protein
VADFDEDGVKDFDELYRFCSVSVFEDTDMDEVPDKMDIRSYTFHDTDHGGHENDALDFPDIDHDGLRAECDCDTDNDSDFDGGEDIDGDGRSPEGGETCVYGGAPPLEIWVDTDKFVYSPDEHVWLYGRTLHQDTTYWYDIIEDCPDLADSMSLSWDGLLFTDAEGAIELEDLGTFPVGIYLVVVDVLRDNHYSEPDNWDPWTCFLVEDYTSTEGILSFRAFATDAGIEITWEVSSGASYTGFNILRAESESRLDYVTPAVITNSGAGRRAKFYWLDETVQPGVEYSYQIEVIYLSGRREIWPETLTVSALGRTPQSFAFQITGANPLRFGTTSGFTYDIPQPGASVSISLYDITGRHVATLFEGLADPGRHADTFDGSMLEQLGSGVYYLRMEAGAYRGVKRIVVAK